MSENKTSTAKSEAVYSKKGSIPVKTSNSDRRMRNKSKMFEENMHVKMEGKEVPKSRKPQKTDMPVSPMVLGICLFLVIGSAFF